MNEEQNIDDSLKMTDDSGEQSTVNVQSSTKDKEVMARVDTNQSTEEQPETLNLKPATETMEVHHHPHVEKKSFKEYLLEGLMIFIAVTMGFFAEQIREHISDTKREKEYIASMLKELRADSVQLAKVFKDSIRVQKLDSLALYFLSGDASREAIQKTYYLGNYIESYTPMIFNRNVLTQLKKGGNMRLIQRLNVVDSLNKLDNIITKCDGQLDVVGKLSLENTKEEFSIFNISYYIKNKQWIKSSEVYNNPALKYLTNDKEKIIKFGANVAFQSSVLENYFYMLKVYSKYSNTLINFLEKEYHLEKE